VKEGKRQAGRQDRKRRAEYGMCCEARPGENRRRQAVSDRCRQSVNLLQVAGRACSAQAVCWVAGVRGVAVVVW